MTNVAIEEKIEIIPINQIDDNPFQPRVHYSTKAIDEIADSADQIGIRQIPEARRVDGRVQLAYGHLRKRAVAKLCKKKPKKWTGMPLRIKELSDDEMFYFAIEENLKRRDITPIGVAKRVETFFTRYPEKKVTEVATKLGMTQGNVSNLRRVLTLPATVLEKIEEDRINFTMGRELLVLQGRQGDRDRYDCNEHKTKKEPVADEELMLDAIKYIINPDSARNMYNDCSKTVNGMKKAIYHVVNSHFHRLFQRMDYYSGRGDDPLFDQAKAGCAKCQHLIKAYETTNQARSFCTNSECWEKLQEEHRNAAAAESAKKAEAEIRKRIQESAAAPAEPESISQEMPEDGVSETTGAVDETTPGVDEMPDIVDETASAVDETTGPTLAETFKKQAEKEEKLAEALSDKAAEAAGTRAEIIDLEDIRSGPYSIKDGYVRLEQEMGIMHDTAECLERCTTGFHYAYDSRRSGSDVGDKYICTNPKCVGKKKAALTREKNAAGTARKKAEMTAIKRAVSETGQVFDKPRLLLIIQSQMGGYHVAEGYRSVNDMRPKIWWWKKIMGVEFKLEFNHRWDEFFKAAERFTEEELAKLIVEFMLLSLCYQGDIGSYRVNTTEALNRMKIGITTEPKGEKKPTGKKKEAKTTT